MDGDVINCGTCGAVCKEKPTPVGILALAVVARGR